MLIFNLLNYWSDFKGQVDVCRDPVGHHLEGSIWGYESDGSIAIKSSKSNALMELNVIYLDTFLLHLIFLVIVPNEQFIVNSKFALRHT